MMYCLWFVGVAQNYVFAVYLYLIHTTAMWHAGGEHPVGCVCMCRVWGFSHCFKLRNFLPGESESVAFCLRSMVWSLLPFPEMTTRTLFLLIREDVSVRMWSWNFVPHPRFGKIQYRHFYQCLQLVRSLRNVISSTAVSTWKFCRSHFMVSDSF